MTARAGQARRSTRSSTPVAQGQRRRPHHACSARWRPAAHQGARLLGSEPRGHRAEPGRGPRRVSRTSTCSSSWTCSRPRPRRATARPTGVTYLIPAASHVEEAGSARTPAVRCSGASRHASPRATARPTSSCCSVSPRRSTTGRDAFSPHQGRVGRARASQLHVACTTSCTARSTLRLDSGERHRVRGRHRYSRRRHAGLDRQRRRSVGCRHALTGSECGLRADLPRDGCAGTSAAGGTIWIYTGAYNDGCTAGRPTTHGARPGERGQSATAPRAATTPTTAASVAYHGWGYSWLVNRRVFYNNSDVPGDVADFFMGPDSCSRLFVSTNTGVLNYSRWYRTIHRLADMPDVRLPAPTARTCPPRSHVASRSLPGSHRAVRDSAARTCATTWGTQHQGQRCVGPRQGRTNVAVAAARSTPAGSDFPLVLTTIRCVEHFQGGPITRNNCVERRARAGAVDRDQLGRRACATASRTATGSTSSPLAATASTRTHRRHDWHRRRRRLRQGLPRPRGHRRRQQPACRHGRRRDPVALG